MPGAGLRGRRGRRGRSRSTPSNCVQCGAITAKGGRLTPPEGGSGPEYTAHVAVLAGLPREPVGSRRARLTASLDGRVAAKARRARVDPELTGSDPSDVRRQLAPRRVTGCVGEELAAPCRQLRCGGRSTSSTATRERATRRRSHDRCTRRRSCFGALREARFRLLWLGQATSTLGDGLVPVALAFAVIQTLDGSPTALGIVLAAQTLPLVAFVLAGGVWADRLPRQMVMLVSDVVRGRGPGDARRPAPLADTRSSGTSSSSSRSTAPRRRSSSRRPPGSCPATISTGRLQQANALLGLSRSLAFVVGPAVAGVIAATANPGIVFVVDSATFAVSATSLAFLRLSRARREGERRSFFADLKGGWHELISHTWLWVIVAWAATFLGIVVAPWMTLGPVVAKESSAARRRGE